VTARTPDGKLICKKSKIYMPHPGRFCRGDQMGRGPYEKCGLLRDTGLAPNRVVEQTFEIPFPYKDIKQGKKTVRELVSKEMDIDVKLWYVPFGEMKGPLSRWNQLWRRVTKKVTIE